MGVLFDIQTDYENPEEEKRKTFKDFAAEDIHNIFLNLDEFAERRDIRLDGQESKTYRGVEVVTGALGFQARQEKNLLQSSKDHSEGLFKRVITVYCAAADLGGNQPEHNTLFEMTEPGKTFFQSYRVVRSELDFGMLALVLGETEE